MSRQTEQRLSSLESKQDKLANDLSELKGMLKAKQESEQNFWQKDWPPVLTSQKDHEIRIQRLETAVSVFQKTPEELAKINSKLDAMSSIDSRLRVLESRDNTYLVKKIENIEVNMVKQSENIQSLQHQQVYWAGGMALAIFLILIFSKYAIDWIRSVSFLKYRSEIKDEKPQ